MRVPADQVEQKNKGTRGTLVHAQPFFALSTTMVQGCHEAGAHTTCVCTHVIHSSSANETTGRCARSDRRILMTVACFHASA